MAVRDVWIAGVLRERWDDDAVPRQVTFWTAGGTIVPGTPRAYTPTESAAADLRIGEQASKQNVAEASAIVSATKATAKPPADGNAWVQPTGPSNAYALNAVCTWKTKTWVSLVAYNVWEPGVANWREQSVQGYPAWVQPTGSTDAYPLGARVSYSGSNWESTVAANVWAPGVYGWNKI